MTAEEAGHSRPAVPPAADTVRDRPVISLSGDEVGLFASDMHLGEHDPDTARQFLSALEREAPSISHLFLLGDLFEAWVGDDQPDKVALELIDMLSSLHARGVWVGVMVGNRDFLMDEPIAGVASFSARSGASLLEDPSLIELFGERVLIAHGDGWCLSDFDYQRFRTEVRSRAWQRAFLSRPLAERLAVARRMRDESEQRRSITDVTPAAVAAPMKAHGVRRVIHGHTHQPGEYGLGGCGADGLSRHVLPDWSATDSRGGFLRVDRTGWSRLPA